MNTLVAEYWIWLFAALVIGLLIAFYVFHASRRTSVTGTSRDVLDDGADRAERNRALIDSDPAAARDPSVPAVPTATAAAPAEPVPPPTDSTGQDELTRLKGVGPKLAARLRELGVARIADIAAWDEADIDRIDAQLGRFQGRIRRDAWVEQARLLGGGDTGGYEQRFGRLD